MLVSMSSQRLTVLVVFVIFATAVATPAGFGQRSSSKSKLSKGDRVEVLDDTNWRPGTVLSVDSRMGMIEVRMDEDEDDSLSNFPQRIREMRLTRRFQANKVRAGTPVGDTRTWTDRSGKFKIEAQFGGMEGSNVVLIKEGGKKVQVPLEKLSDRDKGYVEAQGVSGNDSENPFGESSDVETASLKTKKAILREAKTVRPQTFSKWSFKPTGNDDQLRTVNSGRDIEITLSEIPGSEKFFEKVVGVYPSQDGTRAIVVRNRGSVHQDKAPFAQLVDFTKKRASKLLELPTPTQVLDAEGDADLVMYCPDVFGNGQNTTLTIAKLEGDTLKPISQWEPYAHEDWSPRRDIAHGRFLGPNRVMTINEHGQSLTIWDVETAKALLNIPVSVSFNLKAVLSPDRSLLGVVMKQGIAIIDVKAGRHVATIKADGDAIQQIEFRADNQRLAVINDTGIVVWDLNSGEHTSEFSSLAMGRNSSLTWAGEFLLAEGKYLYDLERRILLWEYEGDPRSSGASALRNGRLYVIPTSLQNRNSDTVLVSAALPHRSALEKAKQLPSAEKLLAVKPGDEVCVEVDIDPNIILTEEAQKTLTARIQMIGTDENIEPAAKIVMLQPGSAQSDLIKQSLTASLQEAGLKVVDKSDLVVKAVCKPQPQQTVRINVDGRWPARPEDFQDHTITPHASYLEMRLKDQVLWQRGFVARPHMVIWVNEGETLEQALQRLTQPNFAIFTNTKFSPYVARPGKATSNGAYGVSQFTSRGIVDGSGRGKNSDSFE